MKSPTLKKKYPSQELPMVAVRMDKETKKRLDDVARLAKRDSCKQALLYIEQGLAKEPGPTIDRR